MTIKGGVQRCINLGGQGAASVRKTIHFTYSYVERMGWSIDLASSQLGLERSSYDLEHIYSSPDAFPSDETSIEELHGVDYIYAGSIALVRGDSWNDWYSVDTTKTEIKTVKTNIGPTIYHDFSITFASPVSYESVFGKTLGALVEDGDTIIGSSSWDSIKLTARSEIVDAREGDDFIDGREGNDRLLGGDGNDTLVGGAGSDRIDGDWGRDSASYAGALKGVTASLANAAINTNDAKGDVFIAIENLIGSSHSDRLTGDGEINGLKGEGGDDWLYGAKGGDDVFGGSGKDVFVFKALSDSTVSSYGRDTIFDFYGNGDRISLWAMDANTTASGNQAFKFIGTDGFHGKAGELRYSKKSSDTYIYSDVNGDRKADFSIHLDDRVTLDKYDFVL